MYMSSLCQWHASKIICHLMHNRLSNLTELFTHLSITRNIYIPTLWITRHLTFTLKLFVIFLFGMLYLIHKYVQLHLMQSTMSSNYTIALPDTIILAILHAHTRASVITNFCLPHTFTLFTDLDQYLSLYWRKYTNMDHSSWSPYGYITANLLSKLPWITI